MDFLLSKKNIETVIAKFSRGCLIRRGNSDSLEVFPDISSLNEDQIKVAFNGSYKGYNLFLYLSDQSLNSLLANAHEIGSITEEFEFPHLIDAQKQRLEASLSLLNQLSGKAAMLMFHNDFDRMYIMRPLRR